MHNLKYCYLYLFIFCLFTEPSAPIIEDLRPTLDYGLNVSWKTDVNSRQETFQVVLRRNDTGS